MAKFTRRHGLVFQAAAVLFAAEFNRRVSESAEGEVIEMAEAMDDAIIDACELMDRVAELKYEDD